MTDLSKGTCVLLIGSDTSFDGFDGLSGDSRPSGQPGSCEHASFTQTPSCFKADTFHSGSYVVLGGFGLILAGIGEFLLGNHFPMVVFISYGS
jgi:hypothetical protein